MPTIEPGDFFVVTKGKEISRIVNNIWGGESDRTESVEHNPFDGAVFKALAVSDRVIAVECVHVSPVAGAFNAFEIKHRFGAGARFSMDIDGLELWTVGELYAKKLTESRTEAGGDAGHHRNDLPQGERVRR